MLTNVQAVVLDLDGTLLDRRRSFDQFIRKQWERFSCGEFGGQEEYTRTLVSLDGDGYAPRRQLYPRAIEQCGLPSDLADVLLRDYRERFPAACVLFADATSTMSRLRAAGKKLGLITNGSVRMQTAKLRALDLMSTFDVALVSDAEGIVKPDPRIFLRACDRLGVSPARAVYVGDRAEIDIAGAKAAGMLAIWRRDPTLLPANDADAVIDELGELPAVLGVT